MKTVMIEGKEIKVGDYVGFKSDVEQGGKVSKIEKTRWGVQLTLTSEYGFSGEYIGGNKVTTVAASDCWTD